MVNNTWLRLFGNVSCTGSNFFNFTVMLNPPLPLLSHDLFAYIVDHVAELPFPNKHLCNLSIADRVFTRFCQRHIFKVLHLESNRWRRKDSISSRLEKMRKILDENPSFANSVRVVAISSNENSLPLFNDLNFISIFQLVAESIMPPFELDLSGRSGMRPFRFRDPILIVGRLMQTFFSQSLTVLHLMLCMDVPFTVFLICPRLREVLLNNVRASMESYDEYPEEQCSGRAFPTLDSLDYRQSGSLVKQMLTPPPRFHTAVPALWSKLRVLTLPPYDREDVAYLQPIIDVTCNTLEELYLTNSSTTFGTFSVHIAHVNLRNLSCLHVLAFYVKCDSETSGVLHDVNLVLDTIPTSNQVTNLTFNFAVSDLPPFHTCLEQDWDGLCDQVVRVSGGKRLTFTLDVLLYGYYANTPLSVDLISMFPSQIVRPVLAPRQPRVAELCELIKDKITSLLEHPNICIIGPLSTHP